MLGSGGEEVLEPLTVVGVERLEGAGVAGFCFSGVDGAPVGAGVDGVKERLGTIVVGGHGGLASLSSGGGRGSGQRWAEEGGGDVIERR